MNKYQEAINKIDDYCYGHSINDSHQNLENDFRLIQELIYKEEKYRWHDLRKDPNDLPEKKGSYLISISGVSHEGYYIDKKFSSDHLIFAWQEVIAWKHMEKFEDE